MKENPTARAAPIERTQERIPDSDYQQLHHFISESNWNAFGVMRTVANQTQQSLSRLKGQQGLLLDESGWQKAGTKSVGVARQYIGQVGKVCNAQVGVFAALVRGERVGIVNARLYLPTGWSIDQPRCKAAGMPTAHQVYQTKAELAVLMLTELEQLVTYDWVGGDSICGNSPTLRVHLLAKKQAFVLDVGQELGVYRQDPALYLPAPPVGRGRKPTRLQTDQKRVSLHSLLAQQSDADWQTLPYRVGG